VLVNGDGEFFLGVFLTDDILVQKFLDFRRARQWRTRSGGFLLHVIADDFNADVYTLITNINRWPRNEFLDLILAFAAETAAQSVFTSSHCLAFSA
jgi:hypothetical protein